VTENNPDDHSIHNPTFGPFSYQSVHCSGEHADVVVSSRVQLFRNIAEHSFVGVCSEDQLTEVRQTIAQCIDRSPELEDLPVVDSEQFRGLERQFLMELQSVIDAATESLADDDSLLLGGLGLQLDVDPSQDHRDNNAGLVDESLPFNVDQQTKFPAGGEKSDDFEGDDSVTLELDSIRKTPFDSLDSVPPTELAESIGSENRLESLFLDRITEAVSMADAECDEFGLKEVAEESYVPGETPLPSHEISVTVNEEDHLRLQMLAGGYGLSEMWRKISDLDDRFQQSLNYAFSPRWGYLSASPANVGTAMRASVLLHLPALAMLGRLDTVFSRLMREGIAGRGAFDEKASGDFYRIGNQVTLGKSEDSLINLVTCVVPSIIDYEREARKLLLRQYDDRIATQATDACRALKLKVRRSEEEILLLISAVRLGISLGVVTPDQALQLRSSFELTRLKRKLEIAVQLEHYTSATKYRDQIRQLEQRHYGH
jgi:protein-arginine kinase